MLFYFYLECSSKRSLKIKVDYYPFGMELPNSQYTNSEAYRYGFNGKENDKEWGTASLTQDYGFRLYNPAIAKFLSVDPLAPNYPWYTPYQFAGNKPILMVDLDGLEESAARMAGAIQKTARTATIMAGHWTGLDGGAPSKNSKGQNESQYSMRIAESTSGYLDIFGVKNYMARTRNQNLNADYIDPHGEDHCINQYVADFANGKLGYDSENPQSPTDILINIHLESYKFKDAFKGAFAFIAQKPSASKQYLTESTELNNELLMELSEMGIEVDFKRPIRNYPSKAKDAIVYKETGKTAGPLSVEAFQGRAGILIEIYNMADVQTLDNYKISAMGFAIAKTVFMNMVKADGASQSELENLEKEIDKFKPKKE